MVNRNICCALAIVKHFKEVSAEPVWSDKDDRKGNDAVNTGKKTTVLSAWVFLFGVFMHSCLLLDCELRTEIRFGFAFKAVSLFEVLSYENSISVSVLNLVSSLSRSK